MCMSVLDKTVGEPDLDRFFFQCEIQSERARARTYKLLWSRFHLFSLSFLSGCKDKYQYSLLVLSLLHKIRLWCLFGICRAGGETPTGPSIDLMALRRDKATKKKIEMSSNIRYTHTHERSQWLVILFVCGSACRYFASEAEAHSA